MNRKTLALLTGLLLLVPTNALARVEDPLELLGPDVARSLESQLANLHADDVDVVVTPRAPAGVDVEARQQFVARHRGRETVLVLVAMQDRKAGVALGQGYLDRGVTAAQVAQLARTHMPPAFERGVPSDGVVELVRELKLARSLGTPPGYVPPKPVPQTPWLLIVGGGGAAMAAAAAALVRRQRRQVRLALDDRLRGERGLLAKLREDLRAIAADMETFAPSPTAPLDTTPSLAARALSRCADLDTEQAELREALRAVASQLETQGTAGIADALIPLARRNQRLQMAVATLTASLRPLRNTVWLSTRLANARNLGIETPTTPDPVACAAAAALACRPLAPADPDEIWLGRITTPDATFTLAAGLVDRWVALDRADRHRPADRPARDGLRARLDDLAARLAAPEVDLETVAVLLDATERMEQVRA